MTLDEVISYNRLFADMETKSGDLEVAEYYRDTAKCLEELKELREQIAEYKRLLKEAVDDLRWLTKWHDPCELCGLRDEDGDCPVDLDKGIDCDNIYKWRLEAEALALIGEDTNVPASADGTNVGHKSGGWISCKDRMPEVNEPVLFIFNTESGFKAVMYGWHETIKGLGSGWHQAGAGGARADEEVTYWQPLPEPPKDGEQNDKG